MKKKNLSHITHCCFPLLDYKREIFFFVSQEIRCAKKRKKSPLLQVNIYEIDVNIFHLSHKLTSYCSTIVHIFTQGPLKQMDGIATKS